MLFNEASSKEIGQKGRNLEWMQYEVKREEPGLCLRKVRIRGGDSKGSPGNFIVQWQNRVGN